MSRLADIRETPAADTTGPGEGPRIGLVLGAGGVAGGAFHAGVLSALYEATGWDPRTAEVIVGTSAGSIAGASLRAGLSAPDLLARALGRPLSPAGARLMSAVGPPLRPPSPRMARPRLPSAAEVASTLARAAARPFAARPAALLAGLLPEGQVASEFISGAMAMLHPHGWPAKPLWVCAVRRSDGVLEVFGRDKRPRLADAVAASCAIPGFFRPLEIDGQQYIDGGVHSPTNADLLADGSLALDLVIVSSPMSYAGSRLTMAQPSRRWSRLLLDAEALQLRRRRIPVTAFQPIAKDVAVMGLNAMDPDRRAQIADQIHASTLRRLERADVRERLAVLRG